MARPQHVQTRTVGHVHIGQDHGDAVITGQPTHSCLHAIQSANNVIAASQQKGAKLLGEGDFIVDNQNTHLANAEGTAPGAEFAGTRSQGSIVAGMSR